MKIALNIAMLATAIFIVISILFGAPPYRIAFSALAGFPIIVGFVYVMQQEQR